jgi:hypothetical protein
MSPVAFRYAAAFAGGALVSALAFQIGFSQRSGLNSSDLIGTMGPPPHEAKVPLGQGLGSATLHETAAGLVLEYDLRSGEPVRIVTRIAGARAANKNATGPQIELEVHSKGELVQRESLGVGGGSTAD